MLQNVNHNREGIPLIQLDPAIDRIAVENTPRTSPRARSRKTSSRLWGSTGYVIWYKRRSRCKKGLLHTDTPEGASVWQYCGIGDYSLKVLEPSSGVLVFKGYNYGKISRSQATSKGSTSDRFESCKATLVIWFMGALSTRPSTQSFIFSFP